MTGNNGSSDRSGAKRDGSIDRVLDSISRRGILSGLVAAGAAVGIKYGVQREVSNNPDDERTPPDDEDPDWEVAADDRIEEHRTTTLEVDVLDSDGSPIEEASVDIEMQEHAFGFGTTINAEYLVEESDPAGEYRTAVRDLFNKAVLENRHKWNFWELPEHREHAETATWWLLEQGLEMRGHTCVWQRRDQGAIPDDVLEAMDEDDAEYVDERSDDHVSDIVTYHSETEHFSEWDVLNEQVEFHEMTELIDPDEPSTRAPKIGDWFRIAADADPDARLYINEYDILVGDEDDHRDALEAIVTHASETDIPIDGIGMQSHHWNVDQRRSSSELLSTLDRFAEHVSSIQITEYDTWGDEWTEELEAEYLYEFLKTVFSHPAVDGFLMWGFWDEIHWQDNAPLFREDWSRKPAYDVYTNLVFDEWWTTETGNTGPDGQFSTDVFLGDHEVTVAVQDDTETMTVAIDDAAEDEVVTVRIE